jgi:hypothetical protein
MLKDIFLRIVQFLFKKETKTNSNEINKNIEYKNDYERIDEINFDAIFAKKLSRYVVYDSNVSIDGENERAKFLNQIMQSLWKKIKKITAYELGTGGMLVVPYVKKGKIFYNLVPQARMTIDRKEGDLIKGATILSEKVEVNTMTGTTEYYRWTNYDISENNVLTISQKYTNRDGAIIPTPVFWKDINEVLSISNVDRVPFGYIKCPQDNRRIDDDYGVPITYGAENTIAEIRKTLKDIADEFEAKKVKLFLDKTMFNEDNKPSALYYQLINAGDDDFWNIFDPSIRESSYYERLKEQYARLETEVGTSKGILTEPTSNYENLDATRRALFDTASLIDDARTLIEDGLNDFILACNVLANTYNLSAPGEYETIYDWDNSYIENLNDTFEQYITGKHEGVVKPEELRQWLFPSETLEESKKIVEEIKEEEGPSIDELLDMGQKQENQNKEQLGKDKKQEV